MVCVCGYYAAANEHGTEKRQQKGRVSFHLQCVIADEFSRKQLSSDVYKNHTSRTKTQNLIIFHKNLIIQQGYFQ